MKKLYIFLFAMLMSVIAMAQTSGGPDAYGYTWKNSNHTTSPPVYSWFDISQIGAEVNGLSDDNVIGPFPIPQGFQFYWYPISQFWIGSNGYISFSGGNIASPFPASIPLTSGTNNFIAPFTADLIFGVSATAKCFYYVNPDTLCVSWLNVPHWQAAAPGYTGSNSFQVIINKTDKSITFNYLSMNQGSATLDAIVGIENNTGTLGLAPMIDLLPSNLFTIKFYYPTTVTYAVTDAGVNWNTNAKNAAIFVKKQGNPLTLQTNVRNYGNQNVGSFTVANTVLNSSNISITSGNVTIPSLQAGIDTLVTYTNTFTAPVAGTYRFRSTVSGLTGDMVPDNNQLQQEIIAIDTTLATMTLDYSDGMPDGTGLGWSGGNGGVGTYFAPPLYPVKVLSSRFFITANATVPVGFYAKIYDDDGLNGGPGTMLDSVFVPPASVVTGMYNTVIPTNNNIVISDGGVYLLWYMAAEGINIGRDTNSPISSRMYEVLYNNWAEYRDKLTEDFLMGINVQKYFPPLAPVADFSYVTTNDPSIAFTDLSTNGPTSWSWTFGDGLTSTVQNPVHLYVANGNYQVCLHATNLTGTDSVCKTITVAKVLPVANFTFTTSSMPTVQFTDASLNNPTAWKWDFDDSGNDSSDVQNPSYTFKANGFHNVCLIASNAVGSSTPACQTVNVVGVGIEDLKNSSLSLVFPNPMSDISVLQINTEKQYENLILNCYSLTGEKIMINYEVRGNQIYMQKGAIAAGTYLFEVYNNQELLGRGKLMVR